jgi:hypothetical protein
MIRHSLIFESGKKSPPRENRRFIEVSPLLAGRKYPVGDPRFGGGRKPSARLGRSIRAGNLLGTASLFASASDQPIFAFFFHKYRLAFFKDPVYPLTMIRRWLCDQLQSAARMMELTAPVI